MKKIWILWGMWPQASAHFYDLMIQKTIEQKPEVSNQDYPYMLISNIPVPDLIHSKSDQALTVHMVNQAAIDLEKAWVDFLIMTCNTMHLFQDEIMQWVSIPFVSMIDCVVDQVSYDQVKIVWLLWSSTTLESWLYTDQLIQRWVKTILPAIDEYEEISQVISRYISWTIASKDIEYLEKICCKIYAQWAESIILGCTELPLIVQDFPETYSFYKSDEILADKTLGLI